MDSKKALTLSIIIPVYNEQRYIRSCLDSIAGQSVPPDEVIVVDNNSSDDTAKIAGQYSFVKIVTESKQGIVYARNCGFNAATSDLLGRTDADVVLPVDWVANIKAFYASQENELTALSGSGRPNNLRFPRICGWLQRQIAFKINRLLLGHWILFGSNMVLPTALWSKIRGQACNRRDIHEDLDLAIHLNRQGYKIAILPNLVVTGKAKRVISNRDQLLGNLLMWPRTLKTHQKKVWIFGWIGAIILHIFSPIPVLLEYIARFIGRPSLSD